MIRFRVATITNDLEAYPQHRDDTEEFSEYIVFLDDDVETFVIDTRDGGFWAASRFFICNNITVFMVDSSEAPDVGGWETVG